jgi:DHA1 family tetracycline resistance protein-like MFS transporter
MIAGLAATAAGLLMVAAAQDLWLLLLGLAVLSVASGLVFSTASALISLAAGDREQGVVLGLSASVGGAARIAGPVAATLLFQHVGISVPLVVGGVLFALCAAGALRLSLPSRAPAGAA